jgi:hypothetical protein
MECYTMLLGTLFSLILAFIAPICACFAYIGVFDSLERKIIPNKILLESETTKEKIIQINLDNIYK